MRKSLTFPVAAIFLLAAASVHAAKPPTPEVSFSFDREQFTAGEPFEIDISVSTEGESQPDIRIPAFQGLEVLQRTVSRPSSGVSFSFSFGTGSGPSKVVRNSGTSHYQYVVLARAPGDFRLGPVEVLLDGFTFKSASKVIRVLAPGSMAQVAPDAADATMTAGGTEGPVVLKNVKIDPDYFLHMETSKETVVQGEMLILSVYLYTSQQGIRLEQFGREPGTDGFWVERFEDFDLRQAQTERVVVENQLYNRVLLKKLALFPVKSGALVITPAVFSFSVGGGFFSMGKTVKRAAQPVTVEVRPLPELGKPAGFEPSNVGAYRFEVHADRNRVKTGDPVTVNLTVSGQGNIRNVVLPTISEIPGLKFYAPEDSAIVHAAADDVTGSRAGKWLIIPEMPGVYTLPALAVSVFDPAKGEYAVLNSSPLQIQVDQGAGSVTGPVVIGSAPLSQPHKDALGRMSAKLRSVTSRINVDRGHPPLMTRGGYLAIVILIPLLFFGYLIGAWIRELLLVRLDSGRSRRADAVAIRQFREFFKQSDAGSDDVFYARLQKILLTFLETRLDAPVQGDTMPELAARMREVGFHDSSVGRVMAFLESCEFARFARSSGDNSERRAEIERAVALVEALSSPSALAASSEGGTDA